MAWRNNKTCLVSETRSYSVRKSTIIGILEESENAWVFDTENETSLH